MTSMGVSVLYYSIQTEVILGLTELQAQMTAKGIHVDPKYSHITQYFEGCAQNYGIIKEIKSHWRTEQFEYPAME